MEIYRKIDPFTNKEFETVSSIKRFETKENQIAYNNEKARKAKKERAFVDDKINHNHFVLEDLLGDKDEVIITQEQLKEANFNFGALTHYTIINGTSYLCVYEYSYVRENNNKQFKIRKNGRKFIA